MIKIIINIPNVKRGKLFKESDFPCITIFKDGLKGQLGLRT